MTRRRAVFGSLLVVLLLAAVPGAGADDSPFHPPVPILDADGAPVVETGAPVSPVTTCGACHDTGFITANAGHADIGASSLGSPGFHEWDLGPGWFGSWDPITGWGTLSGSGDAEEIGHWWATLGSRHAGGGPVPGTELDCFVCHLDGADMDARRAAIAAGLTIEAPMATLMGTGAVSYDGTAWIWDPNAFEDDGSITGLVPQGATNAACGECHGHSVTGPEVVTLNDLDPVADRMTFTTGEVIAGDRLSESGANLAGKADLHRAWDVHAERVVECVDCHHAANNPSMFRETDATRPEHLLVDGRILDPGVYLKQPDHRLFDEQCTDCHDGTAAHDWLPYRDRHFEALACETCHIPEVYAPSLAVVDHPVIDTGGGPRLEWRGVDGDPSDPAALLTGYAPAVLTADDGTLAPHNLVTTWFWIADGRPVTPDEMADALLDDGGHRPEIVAAFDTDGDGSLSSLELAITDDTREQAMRDRLAAAGLPGAEIAAEVRSYPLHHSVTTGEWATDDCTACHGAGSILDAGHLLAGMVPGGVLPEATDPAAAGGTPVMADDGSLRFDSASRSGDYYVFGTDRVGWIDVVGLLAILGVLAGVAVHGGFRWWIARTRPAKHAPTEKIYMYSVYERLWHWLQTIAILLLLVTGLVIHWPGLLGIASFRWVVAVHNIVAAVLLANAVLAAFYHLASGEIRQFIPRPRGFFDRAIGQALYYVRGIFRGERHPFEKDARNKLNPLQQVTYFAILNVLLPIQIVTGILIWGAQRWPDLADGIGGLTIIAPIHTLSSWLFAAFVIMHVYLITTGHTPLSGLKAMITGWDEIDAPEAEEGTTT